MISLPRATSEGYGKNPDPEWGEASAFFPCPVMKCFRLSSVCVWVRTAELMNTVHSNEQCSGKMSGVLEHCSLEQVVFQTERCSFERVVLLNSNSSSVLIHKQRPTGDSFGIDHWHLQFWDFLQKLFYPRIKWFFLHQTNNSMGFCIHKKIKISIS